MALGTPMIPRTITIHLGTPKAAARNVTVPFRDYLKNVASSEIYPTWPESALRANIYAITSFALNRVYTHFYRAQGYAFDITSSTSYDQAFIHGRAVYDSISRVVDEQFNSYIVRQGHIEPMFASYCNGTTARCNGLSQWGSYNLANQNYTPIRILRHFYGNNVEIVTDAPEGDIMPSYPGRLLRRGDQGEDVRTVQTMVRRIARNFPAIPVVAVSPAGVFNGDTDAAVRMFQRVMGLTSDGIVGSNTWYRLLSIFNAVKHLNELDSEGIRPADIETVFSSNLRLGDVGVDVMIIQSYLNFIATHHAEIPYLCVDGIFGLTTDQAVRAFQQAYDLKVDGVVGRETFNRLMSAYSEIYRTLSAEQRYLVFPNYAFSQGDTGENVRLIQIMLDEAAGLNPALQPLAINGIYDAATTIAVRDFQRASNLIISGDVDILTWNALVEDQEGT